MNDMILILNYSDEVSVDAARRLRGEGVLGRIVSGMTNAEQVRNMQPRGILLCGETEFAQGEFDTDILEMGVPVLALGQASLTMLSAMGGVSAGVALSDKKALIEYEESPLFADVANGERYFSEAMTLMLPADVQMIASAGGCTIAFQNAEKKQYGVQFALERNDPEGSAILKNFARDICGCTAWWSEETYQQLATRGLRDAAKRGGFALCAVSGGVDSIVAAMLTHQTFGDRMAAVFVDTGLMREGEAEYICATYEELGIPLLHTDRSAEIMESLHGKMSMRDKREVVINCLHEEIVRQSMEHGDAGTLVLGTNYSDLIHSSHTTENWEALGLYVVEPLLNLFKDEVRTIAAQLGLPDEMVWRKPFPALGLGARIIGEVTHERLMALRMADKIFSEEIEEAGLVRKLYRYFPILGGSDYDGKGVALILRAMTNSGGQLMPARLPYDLVERTVERILEASPIVTRVLCDETPVLAGQESFF